MKKLLITTMAAVSVGLCAKADLTAETFESHGEGSLFGTLPGDSSKYDITDGWETETTLENLFTVTNIANYVGAGTYPEKADRPSKSDSDNALAIDTSAPLLRYADSSEGSQSLSDAPIFFDSVVQFTATDVAPSMENNTTDKLAVWLYTSPDDVSVTNPGLFNETEAKKTLVITAGIIETIDGKEDLVQKNYDTGIEIEPESWHRLTIKSFLNNDKTKLMFNVWLDGKTDPISVDGVTDFLSLVRPDVDSDNYLQGVAFDGKGAVDDIVFTTTAPEFAKEPEAETANVKITINNLAAIANVEDGGIVFTAGDDEHNICDTATNFVLTVGTTAMLQFELNEGFELESPDIAADGGFYTITIDSLTAEGATIAIVTRKAEGGEEPEEPAKPTIGGESVKDAAAFIAAANSGVVIKVPTGWTLDGNTLKDADRNVYATFADYYTVELATDGTVTLELNDTAKPTIGETAADKGDAIVVTDAAVALGVTNAKAGLWYGAQAYSDAACTTKIGDEPTGWEKATGETVTVTATKPEGDKAFFKVVVDDQDHTPAEEPK